MWLKSRMGKVSVAIKGFSVFPALLDPQFFGY